MTRWRSAKRNRGNREKELIGLEALENKIKNAFIEVNINLSRIKKVKENYELQKARVEREKIKGYESLMEKYVDRIKECDRAVKELKERNDDLKASFEEIIVLKTSLRKEEVIDMEGRIAEIKGRLDEIMSRVEIYEDFPPDENR
ncbi:hypothetical protein CW713_08945 [Methanophagales archaeon]|nr:MAG: hypothetical protein CW713_08945 [Methanophagales archaeon]